METTKIIAIVIVLLILAMLFTLVMIFRLVKQNREIKENFDLRMTSWTARVDRAFDTIHKKVDKLGEESAAWATLVEEKFRNQDDVETARRIKKGLPTWVRFDTMKADKLGIDPAEPGTDG